MYRDILKIRNNVACIGKCKITDLVKNYGTPLICYDQLMLESNLKMFKETFVSQFFSCEVLYASKSFSTIAIYQLLSKYNFGADFVSGGELATGIKAGFKMSKGYFHGNNKSEEELELAINNDIGCIVIDNENEITLLDKITKKYKKTVKVMIRLNPGINAHTHSYIQTAKLTSKFGISIFDLDKVAAFINKIINCKFLDFKGLHCHIGSQIFDDKAHVKTAKVMIDCINNLKVKYSIFIKWLNLGGGFGVSINEEDKPYDLKEMLNNLLNKIENQLKKEKLTLEKLIIEPGRSIVSECGATVYTIGGKKETFANKNYLFIDGGMSDNIRPALYNAKYECDVVTKINKDKTEVYSIAGKNCESGDILIEDTKIQKAEIGDLLIIYSTGAYTYSMSSNYNRNLRPAVLFVKNSKTQLIIKRESYDDLLKNDLFLEAENEKI